MKQYKAPSQCPVCNSELVISKLSCSNCGSNIEGLFEPCEFCKLPKDELDFVKVFIKNRGSIKEVEKELGISYPTVRAKLDRAIIALGFDAPSNEEVEAKKVAKAAAKKAIVDKLASGEMTALEATAAIKAL